MGANQSVLHPVTFLSRFWQPNQTTVRVVIDVQPVIDRDVVADITGGEMEDADARVRRVAELVCAEGQRVPPFDVVDSEPRVVRVWPAVRIGG